MPARVDPEMRAQLDGDPDARLEAILVAAEGLEELLDSLPDEVIVQHRYRLISGLAVTASANVLRRVAELPTVKSIEPVRAVRAL